MSSLTIRLPEEKLLKLRNAAATLRKSANDIVEEAIDAYLPQLEGPTLADSLHDYIGAIDGPTTDSSRIKGNLGEMLEQKHREGRL